MTSQVVSLKQYQEHSIKNISKNVKAVFVKLGNITVHHKIQNETHRPIAMTTVRHWPCFIKTNIPRTYLKQGSSTPDNLMGRVKTMWEPHVFLARPTLKGFKWGCLVFHRRKEKRLEPKQHSSCHSVSFAMYISGAKFEEHCSNISGDILDSVFCCLSGTIYDVITFLICMTKKT